MALPPLESWYCKGCEIFFLRIKWSRLESFYEQREISIYIMLIKFILSMENVENKGENINL